MLAANLLIASAPAWKLQPLPPNPCRATSALIGKSYMAAFQTGLALCIMMVLQADVLKDIL